ncbi:MAG TPA: type II toxin-antitoxin system VapB family antitoxin [Rhizomicrobium sp.]|jgi:hypothetical protein
MNVASPRLNDLAQRLARATGEDVQTALERAVEERLSRIGNLAPIDRQKALRGFFNRVSGMPIRDDRPPDEIVGYGPDGLPV